MRILTANCCVLICCIAGCASGPYHYGYSGSRPAANVASEVDSADHGAVVVETGKPRPVIDGIGWVVGIPSKLILWNRRVDNHSVSPETQVAVVQYLEANDLQDVCVRVNQYAPGKEWRRLRENRRVSAGWRYTVGLFSLAGYTIFPGRIFGGDHYNPYTNSLYVYSDVPALAMQGGGYAKDIHSREYPGTYAVVNELPVVSMWHETIATNDVLGYLQAQNDVAELQAGYRILYPYYGSRAGGAAQSFLGAGPLLQIGGAVVGHVTGRTEGRKLEKLAPEPTPRPADQAPAEGPLQPDQEPQLARVEDEEAAVPATMITAAKE